MELFMLKRERMRKTNEEKETRDFECEMLKLQAKNKEVPVNLSQH